MDKLLLSRQIDFVANVFRVYVDNICRRIGRHVPHFFEQNGAGNGVSCIAHQDFKDGELPWRQLDSPSIPFHTVLLAIEFEVSDSGTIGNHPEVTPQQGMDTRQKFKQ
jgi:hypothetical protein